jgi:hypothetical protein
MNMKRGLVLSLCALAVAASASSAMAQATISASLNLRYTDPANPAEGGTWNLVAKTTDDDGIAALVVYLQNAGNAAGTTMATNIGALTQVGNPPDDAILDRTGGVLEIVYGQDMTLAGTVFDVGQPNFGPRIQVDPLRNTTTWNNASLIASGAFGATRPTFVSFQGFPADGNTLPDAVDGATDSEPATVTTIVRGDSVIGLGLNDNPGAGIRIGDVNRDGLVNINDFGGLSANFGQTTGAGWDQGDFNNDGAVNINDFGGLSSNFGQPAPPAPVAAIPEPSAAILLGIALLGLGHCAKRS